MGLADAKRLVLCLVLSAIASQVIHAAEKPNIIYILADDMGYGDVSALNEGAKFKTPNVDRLAKEGMYFSDAHSGSAVCTPTRYGILTGRYCWRTRLKRDVLFGYGRPLIEEGRMTVASLLKKHGYNTACIGKWHIGMGLPTHKGERARPHTVDWSGTIKQGPVSNGFDYFYGISGSLDMHPYIWIENDRFVGECTVTKGFTRNGPAHKDFEAVDVLPGIADKTVEYIKKQSADKPFFIYMSLTSPHAPIVPAKEFKGKSGVGNYGDFCVQTDAVVGQVLKALAEMKLADNTLVIFTADNGCSSTANIEDLKAKGHHPSYVFRGKKSEIYEGGHRIPFVVRWPGKVPAKSKSDEIICLTDLLATCAALLGDKLPANAGEDSYNILPALLGRKLQQPIREATVHHSSNGSFAIRKGKWKLILCPDSGGFGTYRKNKDEVKNLPPIQLYDLEKDVAETTNLQAERPEVVKELTALLEKYKSEGKSVTK